MTTIYTLDEHSVYIATVVAVDPYAPAPRGVTTPPPSISGTEEARWTGAAWEVLPEHPATYSYAPQAVTMRQARLALLGADLLSSVNAAIAAMPGTSGEAARIEWEFSSEVRRNQPLVVALGPALGMSATQLDALFIAAAKL